MEKQKIALSTLLIFSIISAFCLGYYADVIFTVQTPSRRWKTNVYVFHETVNGVSEIPTHNLVTDIGENYVRDILGFDNVTNNNATKWLSVSNDATPLVTWTKLPNEVTANGFTRSLGTVDAWMNSGDYAYNVTYKFTATGTQQLQCAGENWNDTPDSDDNLFAAAAFTQTTFESDDNCTIRFVNTSNCN